MKRSLIGVALCLAATGAMARFSSSGEEVSTSGGVITPDVATDVFRTYWIARDKDGNMLVCPDYRQGVRFIKEDGQMLCRDANGNNAWSLPANVPPRGKTYSGFRVTPNGYYEFYWK